MAGDEVGPHVLFTLRWDPYGAGLIARPNPDDGRYGGLQDGRVAAAWISWEASLSDWWSIFPALMGIQAEWSKHASV